ncbi:MAG: hypothetical protein MZV64_49105 [Ignavibacteriales bacterium]|nr:hypothetical protein [Ignavibacteriales bacterium]
MRAAVDLKHLEMEQALGVLLRSFQQCEEILVQHIALLLCELLETREDTRDVGHRECTPQLRVASGVRRDHCSSRARSGSLSYRQGPV